MNKVFRILGVEENGRLKVLDGVRGIAVLMVFFYHLWGTSKGPLLNVGGKNLTFLFMWGHSGVDLFYILSGFLLFIPFAKQYYTNNYNVSVGRYFLKRALRILPVYYIFIFLTVVLTNQSYISANGLKTLVVNIFFLQNFFINKVPLINGVTWTLAVEVQFYLVLPLIAKMFYGKRNKVALPLTILFVLIYRVIVFIIMKPSMSGINWSYYYASEYNIFGCIDNFAVGITIANIYLYYQYNKIAISKWIYRTKYLTILFPIIFLGLCYNYYNWRFGTSVNNSFFFSFMYDMILYLFFGALILNLLFFETKLKKILSNSVLRIFGVIGYSIYIWHLPIQGYLSKINFVSKVEGWNQYINLLILSLIILVPFSFGMYIFVEKYFIDISSKVGKIRIEEKKL